MRSTRRVTAAFVLLLMLQVLGLGSGVLRADNGAVDCETAMAHTSGNSVDMEGMDEMPMPDAPQSPTDQGPKAPCGLPWALGCTSAAACLPVVLPVAAASATGSAIMQARITAAYASLPESLARAPELPPPRG